MVNMTNVLIPLESNPDVMNKFLEKLGVPYDWTVVDVMGLESDALLWVPRPVISVMLLFPVSEAYKAHKEKQESEILSNGQEVPDDLFYMNQSVGNACGTIALVHSVANNCDKIKLSDGPLKQFFDSAKLLDPKARGVLFGQSECIIEAHKELALEGQTTLPNPADPVEHHFIAFVEKNGCLYELDGSKAFPINHGPTTQDTLLEDAVKICKEYIARDPSEVRFTIMALAAAE